MAFNVQQGKVRLKCSLTQKDGGKIKVMERTRKCTKHETIRTPFWLLLSSESLWLAVNVICLRLQFRHGCEPYFGLLGKKVGQLFWGQFCKLNKDKRELKMGKGIKRNWELVSAHSIGWFALSYPNRIKILT